jgi:hypothetical protein
MAKQTIMKNIFFIGVMIYDDLQQSFPAHDLDALQALGSMPQFASSQHFLASALAWSCLQEDMPVPHFIFPSADAQHFLAPSLYIPADLQQPLSAQALLSLQLLGSILQVASSQHFLSAAA